MEHLVLGIVAFLAVVLAVTTLCRRFELNESLVLMLVGIVGSFLPFVHPPNLSPELILVGALPPLLYASAINTSLVDFRRDASTIGWLSIGLVIFTALGWVWSCTRCWTWRGRLPSPSAPSSPRPTQWPPPRSPARSDYRAAWSPCSRERAWSTTRQPWWP